MPCPHSQILCKFLHGLLLQEKRHWPWFNGHASAAEYGMYGDGLLASYAAPVPCLRLSFCRCAIPTDIVCGSIAAGFPDK